MKHSYIYDIKRVTQRNIQRITMCACVGDRKDILDFNLNASNILCKYTSTRTQRREYSTRTRTTTTTAPWGATPRAHAHHEHENSTHITTTTVRAHHNDHNNTSTASRYGHNNTSTATRAQLVVASGVQCLNWSNKRGQDSEMASCLDLSYHQNNARTHWCKHNSLYRLSTCA